MPVQDFGGTNRETQRCSLRDQDGHWGTDNHRHIGVKANLAKERRRGPFAMLFEGRPKGVELAAGSERHLLDCETASRRVAAATVAINVETRHTGAGEARHVHVVANVEPLTLRCSESQGEILIEGGRLKGYHHVVGSALLRGERPIARGEEEQLSA